MTRLLILLLFPILLLSCQSQRVIDGEVQEKEEKSNKPAPRYLGSIYQVYPNNNFALIRLLGPNPKPGTTLIAHPADGSSARIANLCVSNEKVNNAISRVIAADIRSGSVMKGDAVYIYRSLLPASNMPAKSADKEELDQKQLAASDEKNIIIESALKATNESDNDPQFKDIPWETPTPSTDEEIPDYILDVPDNIKDLN